MDNLIFIARLSEPCNCRDQVMHNNEGIHYSRCYLYFNPATTLFEFWKDSTGEFFRFQFIKELTASEAQNELLSWSRSDWYLKIDEERLQECLNFDYEKLRQKCLDALCKTIFTGEIVRTALVLGVKL